MSDFSLTLVLQIKTSKIINDMAKVQQKSEKIADQGFCDHFLSRLFWSLRKCYYICTVYQIIISTCRDRKGQKVVLATIMSCFGVSTSRIYLKMMRTIFRWHPSRQKWSQNRPLVISPEGMWRCNIVDYTFIVPQCGHAPFWCSAAPQWPQRKGMWA